MKQSAFKTWMSSLYGNRKVFLWGLLLIVFWRALLWVLSQTQGDGKPYLSIWSTYVDWGILFTTIYSLTHFSKQLFGSEKYLSRPWIRAGAAFLGCIIGGVLIDVFYQMVLPLLGYTYDMSLVYFDITLPNWITNTVTYTFAGIFVALIFAQNQMLKHKHYLQIKLADFERKQLESMKDQATLTALRARLNPHFLYNSLNSVASLIHVDGAKAEQMLVALSELFRYLINYHQSHFSSLEEELHMIETYLNIEKIRFGDNLKFSINTDLDRSSEQVPRMLLQPLVENAIKHGTSKIKSGELIVRAARENDKLVVEVEDNGPFFGEEMHNGYGLEHVVEKLNLLYGQDYAMQLISEPVKKVRIELGEAKDEYR